MIEPLHDVVYLCLRQRIHVRAFGHILANQPVGVLEVRIKSIKPPRLFGLFGLLASSGSSKPNIWNFFGKYYLNSESALP